MASPRNHGKNTNKKEATKQEKPKSSAGIGGSGRQSSLNFNILKRLKLRPMEIIGISLLFFAIIVYFLTRGEREPEQRQIAQLADSSQLANKASQLRPLYIIVDSLKLRAKPKLDSNFIRYLEYDELVYDMGEQTDMTQTIRYSADEVRTEPWVKIRTEKGEVGWVFGAGIGFYRKKRRTPSTASTISTITEPSTTTAPSANTTATTPSTATTPTAPSTTATTPSTTVTRPSNSSNN
jgi:hypothetical protein